MADVNNFSAIKIGLASPETIRSWSHGEVKKGETKNYKSGKPAPDGLFCEKIFGPVKSYECSCGKCKKGKQRGETCSSCGVDVVDKIVRRERMGHIELACPVTHIWFLKGAPYYISLVLDVSLKDLESVAYLDKYIVLDKGQTDLEYKQVIDENEYRQKEDEYGIGSFQVGMGAEAIRKLLADVDIEKEYQELKRIVEEKSGVSRDKAIKKLDVISAFRNSGNKPEWMVLTVLPVLPPDLRPLLELEGGRNSCADANELYKLVVDRNNNLKKVIEQDAPQQIINQAKRGLQEAVDNLLDNGKRNGKPKMSQNNKHKLKSLTDSIKGKQGRFRQNLLGKRVDFSGRSVIVIGPELKMYQCGLPREMAIELFKPFVSRILHERGYASSIKTANEQFINAQNPIVWDILEEVIKDHPVLLNRAPTLHRLSIQAFEPVLVEGRAIKLHPLVCTAFNADFDGDQMAVHVPLTLEARAEARILMLSTNNILKLSDGKPVVSPSQDIVIGCYYLTMIEDPNKSNSDISERRVFKSIDEALMAYQLKQIPIQKEIEVRITKVIDGTTYSKRIKTTIGRIIFNKAIPQDLGFVKREKPEDMLDLEVNFVVDKGGLSKIVDRTFKKKGATETAVVLDNVKDLGYKYSTVGAITTSIFDMNVAEGKEKILTDTQERIIKIEKASKKGLVTEDQRYDETIKAWKEATENVKEVLTKTKNPYNPIWMMADSGARGSISQISQLCGMRGIVASTSGKDIELPIKSSYVEGLSVLEYFISAHGGRKGLADTALKTSESGYLTRRLVDVAHSVVVTEEDCHDTKGLVVPNRDLEKLLKDLLGKKAGANISGIIKEGKTFTEKEVFEIYRNRADISRVQIAGVSEELPINKNAGKQFINKIDGRFTVGDIVDPATGEIVVENDTMITTEKAELIDKLCIRSVKIRSILTCKCKNGVCAKCYGKNLASGNIVKVGEAVGVIAAQSIGEPGTQLTMRTFHTGGISTTGDITAGLPRVEELLEARTPKGKAILSDISGVVAMDQNKKYTLTVTGKDAFTGEEKVISYNYDYNSKLCVKDGDKVEAGDKITEGSIYPEDLLRTKGVTAVQDYIIREVLATYEAAQTSINEKHLEIIVRQMLRKVKIVKSGTTNLNVGEIVDEQVLNEANNKALAEDGEPAQGTRKILGIQKTALAYDSFLSAASFQETSKVLATAAIKGKVDYLRGLKENVIVGKLIPAGTGLDRYKNITTVHKASEINRIYEDDTSSIIERTESNL